MAELAGATSTREELAARQAAAMAFVAGHLRPGFDAADVAAGEQL